MKKQFKQLALGVGTLAVVIAGAAAFSAFEAHVINVTARIENGLRVDTKFIDFGTVFPQEHLDHQVSVALSDSFMEEGRVNDVEYFIRQKPKCGITSQNGQVVDLAVNTETGGHSFTGSGHVMVGDNPATTEIVEEFWVDCGLAPRTLVTGETWEVLPDLCPYISKDGEAVDVDTAGGVDGVTPSFHTPFVISPGPSSTITWLDTPGRLAKSAQDISDNWIIDLAVPCFGGFCAQDWADFVTRHNPQADPDDFTQPISNEHKVFGCDLWFEVSGVSETPPPPPPPTEGTLTVIKEAVDVEGVLVATDLTAFSFAVNGGADTAFEADGSNDLTVTAGAHVVAETVIGAGFVFGSFGGDCDGSGNVAVPANGTATCIITNVQGPIASP